MIRRRAPDPVPSVLDAGVVAILLGGWSATPDEPSSAAFDLFQENVEGVVRRWIEHEAWLRAEARRLGIAPDFGARHNRYFGEYLAVRKRERP